MDAVELDLKGRGLRGVDCIALGKILAINTTIHHLNLSDCLLLPQGFQALLDGLGKNSYLKVLELRGNNIQSSMVENLSTFLKTNHTLKQLLLEWNCLGCLRPLFQNFCDALALNKGLERLDLRNNQILDESGTDIANALKQNETLQSLDLRWNSLGIQGAKALWDAVQRNQKLRSMELCGNFVPEEIVRHIQSTLNQRNEKETIIQDFSKRTSMLTNQLQRTEDNYKSEIKNMLTVFDDEEAELKTVIRQGQVEMTHLSQELIDEKNSKKVMAQEINKLRDELTSASEREKTLRESLEIKSTEMLMLEQAVKLQAEELGSRFEGKISKVTKDLGSIQGENDKLSLDLKDSLATIKEKDAELSILQNRIESLKAGSKRAEVLFEERIRKEKENWLNWKEEVESHEHQETQRLQNQLQDIQKGMQAHVQTLENKRAEADEEVNRLKMLLFTDKTEAEENLSRLRSSLNEEHSKTTESLLNQIDTLKKSVETHEVEGKRLDALVRKLESDMGSLTRQNEHLKQHNTSLEEEVAEVRDKMTATLQKARNEAKEYAELASKEETTNKSLRGQVLEMQEQIAVLTMRLNRSEKERASEAEFWGHQLGRRDEELKRLKEDDMKRAALLHEAFTSYMRCTSAATGLPIPLRSYFDKSNEDKNVQSSNPANISIMGDGDGGKGDNIN